MYHELLHAIGLIHEQQRPDFLKNARILYDNIHDGAEHNFKTEDPNRIGYFGVPYDFSSIMHYSLDVSFTILHLKFQFSNFLKFRKHKAVIPNLVQQNPISGIGDANFNIPDECD